MTHKLTQSSTATANTTAPDSEAPDVSMDFDVIRSINNSLWLGATFISKT